MKRKHGLTGSPEFNIWKGMKYRCSHAGGKYFKNYGGRGISVCERWATSFANFLEDMGKRPSISHTIERANNDGNYEPGNCRWATRAEQALNTRRVLDLRGKIFGRLTVIERADRRLWKCLCLCGTVKLVHSSDLGGHKTTSCGCRRIEVNRERGRSSEEMAHV
jgi:hypothetical protein